MRFWSHFAAALCGWSALAAEPSPEGASYFRGKVEPLLERHCYKCHSAGAEKVRGGLLLDSRDALLRGGDSGAVLVPGEPDRSRLVIALRHTDPELQMPKEKLPAEAIAVFEQWVKMGAPDPRAGGGAAAGKRGLWSLAPLRKVEPRGGADADPIDRFIAGALEKEGLSQSGPADRNSLLRRATFDLTGLPPTPDEVREFLADTGPDAFAKVVDRLLASPHFGERWARHWLDLARYGESNGRDRNVPFDNAWRYRDYVIRAFNEDKRYPDFIREQLAGDLLPAKDNDELHEHWIATGFLVIGPKNFGEPNRDKMLMDVADEQIDVTTRAFLGLTVSCARCHDHKFDPIPTRDYYALAGIFRSTRSLGAGGPGPNQSLLSERPLGTPEQTAAAEKYDRELVQAQAKRDAARQARQTLPGGIDSRELDGIVMDNAEAELVGEWKSSTYSTNFVDKNYVHDGNDRRAKGKKRVRFAPDIPADGAYELRLAYTPRYDRATNVPVRVSGREARTVYLNQRVAPRLDKAFESLGVFELQKGTNNAIEILTEGTKGFVAVDAIQLLPKDIQLAAKYIRERSAPVEAAMAMNVPAALLEEYEYKFMELRSQPRPDLPAALAVRDGPPQDVKIHIRGDPERLGAEVRRGFLSVIGNLREPELARETSGRLDLANWIADETNPLTARVAVNRIWQRLFGQGIVGTPDNFGSMGLPPTHPELLDYLAAEFIGHGWSAKTLIRRLMLTRTYQLSTTPDARAHGVDPDNRLLWRANRKRLDAESLRDAMLAVNGSLDRTVGGRLDSGQASAPVILSSGGDVPESNRRSLYLPVLRGAINDLYQVFDFPDPHALAARRYVTTAPTQALFMMNSPFLARQSELWAKGLLASPGGGSDAERIGQSFLRAFGRAPTEAETQMALAFLKDYGAALAAVETDEVARREKAWRGFCHAVYESTEFRFLN